MLLRIVSHFHKQNTHGIDELIRIDGLPEDFFFFRKDGNLFLKSPWERDIDVNIPKSVREHCEPFEITESLPREKNEATGQWQIPVDKITVLGVKLNLDSTPGMETWKQLQRILDRDTPRDQQVPQPARVAPDMNSAFYLEASDIPVVSLRKEVIQPRIETQTVSSAVVSDIAPSKFECGVCQKSFAVQRGLWMHERKTRHKVKEEPVAA